MCSTASALFKLDCSQQYKNRPFISPKTPPSARTIGAFKCRFRFPKTYTHLQTSPPNEGVGESFSIFEISLWKDSSFLHLFFRLEYSSVAAAEKNACACVWKTLKQTSRFALLFETSTWGWKVFFPSERERERGKKCRLQTSSKTTSERMEFSSENFRPDYT